MSFTKPNILTSSATFAQFQEDGLSGLLEALITVNGTATSAPTASVALSETGSGGSLTATTYYVVVTETDGVGETTASPVSTGQAISGAQELVVTYNALQAGNTARNVYVGTASGGPFYLAATGQTGSTTTLLSLPTNSYAVQPPTANSTGFSFVETGGSTDSTTLQLIRAAKTGRLQTVYDYAQAAFRDWNRGDPMTSYQAAQKVRHAATAFAVILQGILDGGGLMDSNAGTLKPSTEGGAGTVSSTQRTWP